MEVHIGTKVIIKTLFPGPTCARDKIGLSWETGEMIGNLRTLVVGKQGVVVALLPAGSPAGDKIIQWDNGGYSTYGASFFQCLQIEDLICENDE